MAKGLQETLIQPELGNRADFNKSEVDQLVHEKGQPVTIETAILCPCKSPGGNQQSNCQNCGGTGWAFINPTETRMVLQRMDAVQKYSGWSEELRGMVMISCQAEDNVGFMDRITHHEGVSLHNEVLFVKLVNNTRFAYAAYNIKAIDYIAKFVATTQKYVRLIEDTDYTFSGRTLFFNGSVPKDSAVTIRYKHAPTFHIVEMKRDTFESFKMTGNGEVNQFLPLSAYARRAHYVLTAQNLSNTRLLNNSYDIMCDNCSPAVGIASLWKNGVGSKDFLPGDTGAPTNGSTSFNFDEQALVNLKSRTLIGFFQAGQYIGQKPLGGNMTYITFTPATGNITIINGTFSGECAVLFV